MQAISFVSETPKGYGFAMAANAPGNWAYAAGQIKAHLDRRGMSQKALALKAGITEASLSRFLDSKSVPSADQLQAIADVLGTPTTVLMGVEPPAAPATDPRIRQLAEIMGTMAAEMAEATELLRQIAGTQATPTASPPKVSVVSSKRGSRS